MGRLDDILDDLRYSAEIDYPGPDGIPVVPEETIMLYKQQIKDLMLEIIGEDSHEGKPETAKADREFYENRFRAELRQKVEEL